MTEHDDTEIAEVVRRVVEAAEPARIVLFGSHARDTATPDSDIDLLVIVDDTRKDRQATYQRIYERLFGVGAGVDIIIATTAESERYRNSRYLAIGRALREGREVYAA